MVMSFLKDNEVSYDSKWEKIYPVIQEDKRIWKTVSMKECKAFFKEMINEEKEKY